MGVPVQVRATIQDWLDLPEDDNRYEVIDGEMYMTPAPVVRHQRTLIHLDRKVGLPAEQRGLGRWYQSPCGVVLDNANGVQPDAFFISKDRVAVLQQEKLIQGAPDLVVEVLSPSTAGRDRILKFKVYAAAGVREYWILDPVSGTVSVYVLTGEGYEQLGSVAGDRRIPSRVFPDLEVQACELFAD